MWDEIANPDAEYLISVRKIVPHRIIEQKGINFHCWCELQTRLIRVISIPFFLPLLSNDTSG